MDRQPDYSEQLPRDEFTARRRDLDNHPEAVKSSTRIDVVGFYGDVTTWVLDLYRLEGEVTAFVQVVTNTSGQRLVIPPAVTAAVARHQNALVTKSRRKSARRTRENLRALSGEEAAPAKRRR